MKKFIFCLMLTTAFFTTNHLYAMESADQEGEQGHRLQLTGGQEPAADDEKARQLQLAMERDRDAYKELTTRLKAEEEKLEYIKNASRNFEQQRKKCTGKVDCSVHDLMDFKDWQRFKYMAAINVKTGDTYTIDVISSRGLKSVEEDFLGLLKTDVEFQPLAEHFVIVSPTDPTDPYQSQKVHAYRSTDGDIVIVQTNHQDTLRKMTEAILRR